MDPVNYKELKGKFKDRKDKDIDNDGDVDSSDEYLHKRRKAVSKAIGRIKEAARKCAYDEAYVGQPVNSADKKAVKYIGPDGKTRERLVPAKRNLTKESVELNEIQISWHHKTQKYHTIKHPDGSHWGVFDHRSYGTKGHEIRKIRDSEGNPIKAADSRRNHSTGYRSGMGSPSDAAKEWAKKHGGTITNHKIKEGKEYGPGHIGAIQRMLDKERKYKKPTQAEIDADRKKTAKSVTDKQYGGYKTKLRTEKLDEVSTEKLRDYASAALQDKNKAKADKRWKYASKAMKTVGDREASDANDRKYNRVYKEQKGLWDNIHAKRKRIKAGSGEKMRKPGSEGAPTDADFKRSQTKD